MSDVGRLMAEHLADEVVSEVAVVSGEVLDERGRVSVLTQGQCGELQPGDPSFGTAAEGVDVLLRQGQAHR